MVQNAYLLTKIGADTAEKERHFVKIAKFCNYFAIRIRRRIRAARTPRAAEEAREAGPPRRRSRSFSARAQDDRFKKSWSISICPEG